MTAPWTAHRVPVFAGQHDSHLSTGEDYDTRTLAEIFNMVPTCRPKMAGFAFIPSDYAGHDARCHRVQRERGAFLALCADVDAGNQALERMAGLVGAFASDAAWRAYSSPHSRPGDMRWRVIIPLATPVPFADWHDAQLAFFAFCAINGVEVDSVMSRAGQPVYLPNVPRFHGKTGQPLRCADGAPLHYANATSGIDRPGLKLHTGPMATGIVAIRHQRADDGRERERIRREAEARRARQPISNVGSIIADFNKATAISTLLQLYGYEQSPRNPDDWRSRYQSGDSYATRVIVDRWISLSGSDAAAGIGRQCDSGRSGDAYDLFVHFEHRGNHKAAFRRLHAERMASAGRAAA